MASECILIFGYLLLILAALVPTTYDHSSLQWVIHCTGGAGFFLTIPIGIFLFSFAVRRDLAEFSRFSRYLVAFYTLGTLLLVLLYDTAVPGEIYALILITLWNTMFAFRVLTANKE